MQEGAVLVLQSWRASGTVPWIDRCMESVRDWSLRNGCDYRRGGDEIFALVPGWYRDKAGSRLPVMTDLGRLVLMRRALEAEDYGCVLWFDADTLIFDASLRVEFTGSCAFGREVWVQPGDKAGYRATRNVHNAVCAFRRGCPVLPFLIQTVESIIRRADPGHIAPQMVGPKLLTALHNIAGFCLLPAVGALSPAVLGDLAAGGGPALDLLRRSSATPLQAANLCASVADPGLAEEAVRILLSRGSV